MSMYHPNHHELANVRRLHAGDFEPHAVDEAIRRAIPDDHQWERAFDEDVRIRDWRGQVGKAVAREWSGMTFATRVAIALDAECAASQEA